MKKIYTYIGAIAGVLLVACLVACSNQTALSEQPQTKKDTIAHGYNELANRDGRKTFSVSDYNTDNEEIENIARPSASSIQTQLDTALLFGIWTTDPNGPHADFKITNRSFYVVDYDGDGDMPYELADDKLNIYYNDFIQEGKIISVSKEHLQIIWEGNEDTTTFVRWEQ
ncbi:MAG TPA: hypothetical protein VK796_01735 [Cytophaga sp.]|jgi:hypothetical protein|nr:hypothetical protein [Cytophaga sp.]